MVIAIGILIVSSLITGSQGSVKRPWDLARDKGDSFAPFLYLNTTFFYIDESDSNVEKEATANFLRPDALSQRKDVSLIQILREEELGEVTNAVRLTHSGFVDGNVQLYHKLSLDGVDAEVYSFYRFEYTTNLNSSLSEWIVEAFGLSSATLLINFTLITITMRWIYEYEPSGNRDYFIKRPEIKIMRLRLGTSLYDVPLLKTGKTEYSELDIKTYVASPGISTSKDIVIFTGNEYYRPSIYLIAGFVFLSLLPIVGFILLYKKRGRRK